MRSSQLPRGRLEQEDLEVAIGYSINDSYDLTNRNAKGFKPGITVRYTPGIHYVDEDFVVMPESNKIVSETQFTLGTTSKRQHSNLYGANNLSTSHLYATSLRIRENGFNLEGSRSSLRPCDESNYHIAKLIRDKYDNIAPPSANRNDDKVSVDLYVDPANCMESDGLIVYGAPGSGKTKCMIDYYCRAIDTDYIYSPTADVITKMAKLGYTIFTNDYSLATPAIPTILYQPVNGILTDRILSKVGKPINIVASWINDLNRFISDLERNEERIVERNQCVIIVKSGDDQHYIKKFMNPLCRK